MERMQNATDLSILTAAQLMAADRPPRSDLLPPWLASDTAALVYGPPGIGKSFLALGHRLGGRRRRQLPRLAQPPAAPRALCRRRDGRRRAARSPRLVRAAARPPSPIDRAPRLAPAGRVLDLGTEDGIVRLMAGWNDPQLVVLDTLSALAPSALRDRDPGRRDALHCFLLHLKQTRRAVLMVDHADKRGVLNGRARRARAADLVMALRPPGAGAAGGNARFEIHFEKTRQRVPLFPILAELQTVDGAAHLALGRGLPRRPPRGAGQAGAQPARRRARRSASSAAGSSGSRPRPARAGCCRRRGRHERPRRAMSNRGREAFELPDTTDLDRSTPRR